MSAINYGTGKMFKIYLGAFSLINLRTSESRGSFFLSLIGKTKVSSLSLKARLLSVLGAL